MPQIFVPEKVYKKLKQAAECDKTSMGKEIGKLLGLSVTKRYTPLQKLTAEAGKVFTPTPTDADIAAFDKERATTTTTGAPLPKDPEGRWQQLKKQLEYKCGCILDDDLEVVEVVIWSRFKAYNDGVLYQNCLAAGRLTEVSAAGQLTEDEDEDEPDVPSL